MLVRDLAKHLYGLPLDSNIHIYSIEKNSTHTHIIDALTSDNKPDTSIVLMRDNQLTYHLFIVRVNEEDEFIQVLLGSGCNNRLSNVYLERVTPRLLPVD